MKNLSKIPTSDLRKELAARGYAVENLWQACDITNAIEDYNGSNASVLDLISVPERLNMMNKILKGDGIQGEINSAISDYLDDKANGTNIFGYD